MEKSFASFASQFRKNISEIHENDYGDFMRAANVYLNEMRTGLKDLKKRRIHVRLDQMQVYLQFKPNGNIKLTKEMLFNDTNSIEELLHRSESTSTKMESVKRGPGKIL